MLRKVMKNKNGETIVEIMASVVIFLIVLGVLTTAINFSSNALHKSRDLRENEKLQVEALYKNESGKVTEHECVAQENFEFRAVSATGVTGNVVFDVSFSQVEQRVLYDDANGTASAASFYVLRKNGGSPP